MTMKPMMLAALLAVATPSQAQPADDAAPVTSAAEKNTQPATRKASKSARKPTTANKPPAIDPQAIAALEKMGAFLREQQSFTVRTSTETDYALDSGQLVRLASQGQLRVRKPDRLRADVVSDRKQRQFFYDGKTLTMYGERVGYYATVAAPPTVAELADFLQDRYGLELPLVDMFRWGTDASGFAAITSAVHVGSTKIDGVDVEQYAFRQPGLDWQIWIQRGAQPLPRKLVLTTTDDRARPEHAIELAWALNTSHEDSVFAFVPPADSRQIALVEISRPPTEATRSTRRAQR